MTHLERMVQYDTLWKRLTRKAAELLHLKRRQQKRLPTITFGEYIKALPSKGEITIFNRSHYEDIIEVHVHKIIPRSVWYQRYRQINEFEQYLSENNIKIIKLFLHISRDEQNKRLEDRLKDPKKRWKIDEKDIQKRKYWDEYLKAHEDIINKCNASWAPWYIIPSNIKWFRNIVVATILVHILESMNLSFPKPKVDISKMTIE